MTLPTAVVSTSEKSTTVRDDSWRQASWRRLGRALQAAMPALYVRLLRWQMLRPNRRRPRPAELAVLATAQRLDFSLHGQTVAVYAWGQGRAVWLAHGWAGSAAQMTPLVAPLLAAGYRVLALDMPAHGASGGRQSSVRAFCEALQGCAAHHGQPHALLAHSFAALAVTAALSRGLRAEKVVYVGALLRFAPIWRALAQRLQLSAASVQALQQATEQAVGWRFAQLDSTVLAAGLPHYPPLLLLHDEDDRETSWRDAAQLAAVWPGAALQLSKGLGHARILAAADTAAALCAFLQQAAAVQPGRAPLPAPCY